MMLFWTLLNFEVTTGQEQDLSTQIFSQLLDKSVISELSKH